MDAPVIERRATAGITASGRVLSGYAAVYGVDTKIGGFTERIAPGAFKETLAGGRDVLALADHDQRAVLGRTKTGTLTLHEDGHGLAFTLALLNQRITIEQRVEGQDEAGQPFEDWLPYLSAWAAVYPLRGREIVAADAVASITDVRVIIRYRPGITPAMRVQHGTDTYSIESVANIASAGREIELLCKRVA